MHFVASWHINNKNFDKVNLMQMRAFSLQLITHPVNGRNEIEGAKLALEGGCKWIQLRMKETPVEEVKKVALELLPLCKQYDAVMIIDDHVELAKEVGADGVHLGKTDMNPKEENISSAPPETRTEDQEGCPPAAAAAVTDPGG